MGELSIAKIHRAIRPYELDLREIPDYKSIDVSSAKTPGDYTISVEANRRIVRQDILGYDEVSSVRQDELARKVLFAIIKTLERPLDQLVKESKLRDDTTDTSGDSDDI